MLRFWSASDGEPTMMVLEQRASEEPLECGGQLQSTGLLAVFGRVGAGRMPFRISAGCSKHEPAA
jgi:hypothetical protein